jgi:ywiA protein
MKYLSWNCELKIIKTRFGKYILRKEEDNLSGIFEYLLNDTAVKIVSIIDGTKTYDEVIDSLSKYYNEQNNVVKNNVDLLLSNLKAFDIDVIYNDIPIHNSFSINNSDFLKPTVASIEITSACNLKCRHCYGEFGSKSYHMPLDKIVKLLDDLEVMGVKMIELTGGDISVHPDLQAIIKYALSKKFVQVALLTNGILLKDETLDLLIENKQRVVIQIDLHSMKENYNNWFTQTNYGIGKIKRNIEYLCANGVKVRVAMIVTVKNIDDIIEVADWAFIVGAIKLGISPVVPLGRANDDIEALAISDVETLNKMEKILESVNKKYPNFIAFNEDGLKRQINCGCVTSHVVIDTLGNIKLCTMDNLKYISTSLGNVFNDSVLDIYKNNMKIVDAIFNLNAPKKEMDTCKDCDKIDFCEKCLLRALISASDEKKGKCKWYEKEVPLTLKKILAI